MHPSRKRTRALRVYITPFTFLFILPAKSCYQFFLELPCEKLCENRLSVPGFIRRIPCQRDMEHAGSLSPTTPEHQGVGTVWRQVAVKPYDFRLTKTQLAVRRSGPRFSNNYCVSAHCKAIFLWFAGHFHRGFAGFSPHKRVDISPESCDLRP